MYTLPHLLAATAVVFLTVLTFLTTPANAASYVFTVFTSSSESNLYVYTSTDATTFTLLAGPTYEPSGTLIRDPSIILHSDGLYYITYTTAWTGTDFAIAKSSDLVNWTLHTTVTISNTSIARTWAPEFYKDPSTGKIHIVVSLGSSLTTFNPYLLTADDSTLLDWSDPVVLDGIGPNYIDTFLIQYPAGVYHAFTKNETGKHVEHAIASSVTGPYTFVQTGDFAGWGRAEGPCLTTLEDGNFRLFADGYDSGKYIYSDSPDLYNWSTYETLPGGLSGFVRHGTVLRLN
ncbi:hypothetical protein RUND412_007561 [Rhizina undulata]